MTSNVTASIFASKGTSKLSELGHCPLKKKKISGLSVAEGHVVTSLATLVQRSCNHKAVV